jgi:vacuolar-type H+-ATPase subunit F/Vma7
MSDRAPVFVVPSELEVGFGLAGVETVVIHDPSEILDSLTELMSQGEGLIAVYEPYLAQLADREREAIESSLTPIVVRFPAGLERRSEESHRARIAAMLSRAVGYHITFGGERER